MPIAVIHPGEHLAEELKALNMSAAELARQLGVPTNRVTQILHGTRSVTGDTALRLAHFFGSSPQLWLLDVDSDPVRLSLFQRKDQSESSAEGEPLTQSEKSVKSQSRPSAGSSSQFDSASRND